ncbi:MAG TPA: MFS transporter [bacterium]|nr:MFS transporter [bacterium]
MTSPPAQGKRSPRIVFVTALLATEVLITLLIAVKNWTSAGGTAVLITALTIVVLDFFPIYLDPAGELRLSSVITIPTLVLFGWPTALLGAAIGSIAGIFHQPRGATLIRCTERLACLIAAAALVTALGMPGPGGEVAAVVYAALGYTLIRTLVISTRMHTQEAIAWPRAFRFLVNATFFHLGVFTAVAIITVWLVNSDPSTASRLLGPMLAAGMTLQLYLPRILRGQEQRRVLAAVSVLAAAVDAKDPYTAGHSADVAELSRRVARILNLDEPEVHRAYLAGLLHDVGKMVVPSGVLLKPGKLTAEEWDVMRSHVEAGVHIVETIGGLAEVAPIVAASHEQLDGRGYPAGLQGDAIPLGSRINLVVDAYNALTTNRPYRAARSSEEAIQELEKHAGTQFDPRVIAALRAALWHRPPAAAPSPSTRRVVGWLRPLTLLRHPAYGLLWVGQLVSFLGDEIFTIALTAWVLALTHSATLVALTFIMATIGQGLLGFFAGALADRMDRRGLMIVSDLSRAAFVALLPLIILHSLPVGFGFLILINVGTVFFRSAVYALMPSVVATDDLPTGNALFVSTERIAEIVGGPLGGILVVVLGFQTAFYIDAATFLFSGVCVGLMPVAWRAGLGTGRPKRIVTEIGDGLRYIWQTPLHRLLALLIFPGYLTLAFAALRAPMIIQTAGLPVLAYGIITGAIGVGKLVSVIALTFSGKRWTSVPFTVIMFLLTALAIAWFGSGSGYATLIAAAFLFGVGNIATTIANVTISMASTPSAILGRVMASRQVFIAATTLVGTLVFGRLADVAGPPYAIVLLGAVSGVGTFAVWILAGQWLAHDRRERRVPGRAAE